MKSKNFGDFTMTFDDDDFPLDDPSLADFFARLDVKRRELGIRDGERFHLLLGSPKDRGTVTAESLITADMIRQRFAQ